MRRTALPVLALLAVLLALWWGSGERESAPARDGEVVHRDDSASEFVPGEPIAAEVEDVSPAHLAGSGPVTPAAEEGGRGTLRCLVLDPDGEPRARSLVTLERLEIVDRPSGLQPPVGFEDVGHLIRFADAGEARTDAEGAAVFPDLSFGSYHVSASAPEGLLAPHRIAELATAKMEVVLSYRRGVAACVEVVDPDGEPVANTTVTLLRAQVKQSAETDGHGIATLLNLDPEWDVGLRVRPPLELDLFEHHLDHWPLRDPRVVLERALTVSGRVIDEHGTPVPGANVHRRLREGAWSVTRAGLDGRFRFRKLRAGDTVTFRLGPPGAYASALSEVMTAEAGTHGLDVVLPGGGTLRVVVHDWPEGARCELCLTSIRDPREFRTTKIGEGGRCAFSYLSPDTPYVLWGTLRDDERFLYRAQVRVQGEPVRLHLQQGEGVEVQVQVQEGVLLRGVMAYGLGVRRRVKRLDPTATRFRIPGLPAGRWTVQALGTSTPRTPRTPRLGARPQSWVAETEAEPGDKVELTLQPVEGD